MSKTRMHEKIKAGEVIDISNCKREGKFYILEKFVEEMDYCDAFTENWVWSIGRRSRDGVILASLDPDLYLNPDFECLWLR